MLKILPILQLIAYRLLELCESKLCFLPIVKFNTSFYKLPATSNKQSGQARLSKPGTSGQALIILLLVMVVALTIGLSVASRTLTDVRISTQSELSQKAFSAAEAGIEEALRQDLKSFAGAANISISPDATYTVEVTSQGAGTSFVPDRPVEQEDVAQICINVAASCPNPNQPNLPTRLNIYWIDQQDTSQTANPASIEISEVYLEGSYKIFKQAFNSDCGRSNGFSCSLPGSYPLADKTYTNKLTFDLHANSQILRIKPLYNRASVAVEVAAPAGASLPTQSYSITSTGAAGGVVRKVQVSRSIEALSPIFDYVLYSGSNLSK